MDFSLHSKKTLYVVAGFYVVVGFVLAIASVVTGDRLGTFLGFLIVSGALVGAAILRAIIRLGWQADRLGRTLEDIQRAVLNAEASVGRQLRKNPNVAVRMIDLSTFGAGDPSVLTAATLDRDAYPRLVTTMEESPPASGSKGEVMGAAEPFSSSASAFRGPATKNLLRQWKTAMRDGDLTEGRRVLSTLVDVASAEELAPLEAQLAVLADRVERGLRQAFTAHVRNGDLAGALAVGTQIMELLPDRCVARDFEAIKNRLERCRRDSAARSAMR